VRRDELRASIDRDPDAIVELVMTLTASVAALRVEVDELKRQLGRDSHNSSLAPSRDSPAARAKRPKKGRDASRAGSPGTRAVIASCSDPDRVVEHWPDACGGFGAPIAASDRVEWVAWFNNDRLHESLGDLPPAEFETLSTSSTVDLLIS